MKNLFFFFLLLFSSTAMSDDAIVSASEVVDSMELFKQDKKFLFFEEPSEASSFETVTYLREDSHDLEVLESFYQYAKIIGVSNGAAIIDNHFTERSQKLLATAGCLRQYPKNEIDIVFFSIINKKKCYLFSYNNKQGFYDILYAFSDIVSAHKGNSENINLEVYKEKFHRIIEDISKSHAINEDTTETFKEIFDYGFDRAFSL